MKLIKVKPSLNSIRDEHETIGEIDFIPALHSYLNLGSEVCVVKAIEYECPIRSKGYSIGEVSIYVIDAPKDWRNEYIIDMAGRA